jgi:esterase/lipase
VKELKEYENKVLKERAEGLESVSHPLDEFCEELEKKIGEVKKELEEIRKPFGKWDSFGDCVSDMKSKGYSEESAKRICGSLKAKLEG